MDPAANRPKAGRAARSALVWDTALVEKPFRMYLRVLIFLLLALGLVIIAVAEERLVSLLVLAAGEAVLVVLLLFLRRRLVKPAVYLFHFLFWVGITFLVGVSGGVRSFDWVLFVPFLASAGLLLGLGGAIGFGAASAASVLFFLVWEATGRSLPVLFPFSSLFLWFLMIFAFVIIIFPTHLVASELMKAVADSRSEVARRKAIEEDLRVSLDEKQAMFSELQHRVKNSFMQILGIITLESLRTHDEVARNRMGAISDRVRALSNLYTILYKSASLRAVRLDKYLAEIVRSLEASYLHESRRIEVMTDLDPLTVEPNQAAPLGLILNELFMNALKYAFPPEFHECRIRVTLHNASERLILEVGDNGAGVPEDFRLENTEGLGMQIVKLLTDQLKGSLTHERTLETVFRISIPASIVARIDEDPDSF